MSDTIEQLRAERDALLETCKSCHELLANAIMLNANNLSSVIAAVRGRLGAVISQVERLEEHE